MSPLVSVVVESLVVCVAKRCCLDNLISFLPKLLSSLNQISLVSIESGIGFWYSGLVSGDYPGSRVWRGFTVS